MTTHYLHTDGAVVADLRERRVAAGLSQLRLAVAADVHVNSVARAEAGARIAPATREALERALAAAEQVTP